MFFSIFLMYRINLLFFSQSCFLSMPTYIYLIYKFYQNKKTQTSIYIYTNKSLSWSQYKCICLYVKRHSILLLLRWNRSTVYINNKSPTVQERDIQGYLFIYSFSLFPVMKILLFSFEEILLTSLEIIQQHVTLDHI